MTADRTAITTLPAIAFEQRPGCPRMYVTAARAADILEWADAPRATVDLMALYQRALDPKRAPELTQFIKADPMNIVPGSVIIATTPGSLEAAPLLDTEVQNGPVTCKITISSRALSRELALRSAIDLLNGRLSDIERNVVSELEENPAEEVEELKDFDEVADDDEDAGLPTSYLTVVAADLERAADDWGSLESK